MGDRPRHSLFACENFDVRYKRLGILIKTPFAGGVTRLVPPLTPAEARGLYSASLAELLARVSRLKKVSVTVFHSESAADLQSGPVPLQIPMVSDEGCSPGERLEHAFRTLLGRDGPPACVIGSDCPDLPLVYIKRAFLKLKHNDVVLGPRIEGGCYLVGLKSPAPELLRGLAWEESSALREALRRVESERLSLGLLPPWYGVDGMDSLSFLETMLNAGRIAGVTRLRRIEQVLGEIRSRTRAR